MTRSPPGSTVKIMRRTSPIWLAFCAVSLLSACAHAPTREELAALTPATLAGCWVTEDKAGHETELHLGPRGAFWSLTDAGSATACRAVGRYWVEDGKLVRRYRTNDCRPAMAGHAEAAPIVTIGRTRLGLSEDGAVHRFHKR